MSKVSMSFCFLCQNYKLELSLQEQERDVTPEWKLMTIGSSVSVLTGRTIAFKHVIVSARKQELFKEFQILCTIYNLNHRDSDSFFLFLNRMLSMTQMIHKAILRLADVNLLDQARPLDEAPLGRP